MAAVTPPTIAYWATKSGAGQPWNSDYVEFTKATYIPTDRSAFLSMAAKYKDGCASRFAQMVAANKESEAQLKHIREVLVPAATSALNNIAKAGDAKMLVEANKYKMNIERLMSPPAGIVLMTIQYGLEKLQYDPTTVNGLAAICLGALKRADTDMKSVNICYNNIKDESVPAKGAIGTYDCGYWTRVIYLFQIDFDGTLKFFSEHNAKLLDLIAKVKADVGSIFDIDDKLNGANSFRNKNKQLVAKEEFEEEQKQKKIAASKVVFEKLAEAASSSPISSFIQQTLANIAEAGNLYESVPVYSEITSADNLLVALKKRQDNLLANISSKKFDDLKKITDDDVDALSALAGSAYTEDDLKKAIKNGGVKPAGVVLPNITLRLASINANLRNLANAALSTRTTENAGGKTPAEIQAEADALRKKQEEEKLAAEKKALEEAKAAQDAAKIAELEKKLKETEEKAIAAAVAVKEAEEKKKKEEELAVKLKDELVVEAKELPKKQPRFMESEIAGIPTPYVVGGGVALLALILISRR